jgi:coiled-coil domain-containing protein 78
MDAAKDIRASGIPAVTFVRVQVGYPGERGEISVDSNAVSVFEAGVGESSRHEGYASVFDKATSDAEVCEEILGPDAAVNPMAAMVGDGATILMLTLGSRKTKKHIFNKRSLLPFICNELFAQIQDKANNTVGPYETAVKFSAFEIQDEVVTDLLRPSNRGLVISATPEEGIQVANLTSETHTAEATLQRSLEASCDNRATHTLPPGGSVDTSSCVWELELIQDEEVSGGSIRTARSKFVVVEVPSTDPLILSASEMRQLEGPTLHKSLNTFVDVAKKLATPQMAAIAPFRSAKLTHFLSEMLGGNAVVLSLAHTIPGESRISRKTLEVTSNLAQSVHYPITGHDMTGVLRGLLTKYRSLILQLQDEIANGAPIGDAPPELSEKRLSELQTELAQAHIAKNQTKEDYMRLYEMMAMLKEKYKTLTEQKTSQSKELIAAEEEKLNIARALVELKLEHSSLLETSEKDKYELSSSLLAAKSEIYDLDAQLITSKSEAASAKESAKEVEK